MSSVYWFSKDTPQSLPPLRRNIEVDVLIVGGGVTGLSAAKRCLEKGVCAALIEREFCGAGASGLSSGFITPESEIDLQSLVSAYGNDKAKRLWDIVRGGVGMIRQNIEEYHLECEMEEQDSLVVALDRRSVRALKKEHQAYDDLGYKSTLYNRNDLSSRIASPTCKGAIRYPGTFAMNAFLYCQGLRNVLRGRGLEVYEETALQKIEGGQAVTDHARVRAKHIIVCTDHATKPLRDFKKKVFHVQTFLGISRPLSEKETKAIFPTDHLMVWDTKLIYNYFRLTPDNRLLVGGGDLRMTYARKSETDQKVMRRKLERYLRKTFPNVPVTLDRVWSGMLGVSKDLLPVVGRDPHHEHVIYAGAATGLPWGTAIGDIAARSALDGTRLPLDFSPNRPFPVNSFAHTLLGNRLAYALSHAFVKYLR